MSLRRILWWKCVFYLKLSFLSKQINSCCSLDLRRCPTDHQRLIRPAELWPLFVQKSLFCTNNLRLCWKSLKAENVGGFLKMFLNGLRSHHGATPLQGALVFAQVPRNYLFNYLTLVQLGCKALCMKREFVLLGKFLKRRNSCVILEILFTNFYGDFIHFSCWKSWNALSFCLTNILL